MQQAIHIYPEEYRLRLQTSNGIERVDEGIRRRERIICIFFNREVDVRTIVMYSWRSGQANMHG
ncbi:hypothetical protein DX130_20360 [Paenibacillus paeoniae]|uniref:Transposase n=1 Tax=Paenibacillus paeoniae TaxID=2292705 RepID=A0A371P675_9BACL|nr:hypothetical protein DX130_20360 [Paenibacillus paeoniae]